MRFPVENCSNKVMVSESYFYYIRKNIPILPYKVSYQIW